MEISCVYVPLGKCEWNELARNNQSHAHDNEVLGNIEAASVVKVMANLITFINSVEEYRKSAKKLKVEEEFNLTF